VRKIKQTQLAFRRTIHVSVFPYLLSTLRKTVESLLPAVNNDRTGATAE